MAKVSTESKKRFFNFSFGMMISSIIGILLFGIYIGVLIYGENSLIVLDQLKQEKKRLTQEAKELKTSNQKLQKEYFELKHLEPKEEKQHEIF